MDEKDDNQTVFLAWQVSTVCCLCNLGVSKAISNLLQNLLLQSASESSVVCIEKLLGSECRYLAWWPLVPCLFKFNGVNLYHDSRLGIY